MLMKARLHQSPNMKACLTSLSTTNLQPRLLGSGRVEEFSETQLRDVPLLVGGDAKLGVALVVHSFAEGRENLFGRAARGAYDEDEAEALFVLAVGFGERGARLVRGFLSARLLAL